MADKTKTDERRRHRRVTLVGPALISAPSRSGRALSAVLDNANRLGAGFHAREQLQVNETVSVTIAFLDQEGDEQQEKLSGRVAWVRPWEKGYLIGIVWDQMITKEQNRWLYSYLNETLKETA
ncbi:PilZ domain-containing protein [Candidatus Nitrospira bockiana]